jgi:light-harvesting complex 1 beta chain
MDTTHAQVQVDVDTMVKRERFGASSLIFVPAFTLFLAIALIGQTLGRPWRSWLPGAESELSVTGGVKAAVYTFMSYLH